MNPWIGAAIAIAAGVVLGVVVSRVVARLLGRSRIDSLRESAPSLAALALSIVVVIGLLVALGFVADDELERLGDDAIAFLPSLISALVIVIIANVAATFAGGAVDKALAGTGVAHRFAPLVTRAAILVGGAIIAARQMGVDTAIINIAVAAALFGVALAFALLAGLGGRAVASEIAAGRAIGKMLRIGDLVGLQSNQVGRVDGVVADLHPTAVELVIDGRALLIPNTTVLAAEILHERPGPADAAGELDR